MPPNGLANFSTSVPIHRNVEVEAKIGNDMSEVRATPWGELETTWQAGPAGSDPKTPPFPAFERSLSGERGVFTPRILAPGTHGKWVLPASSGGPKTFFWGSVATDFRDSKSVWAFLAQDKAKKGVKTPPKSPCFLP